MSAMAKGLAGAALASGFAVYGFRKFGPGSSAAESTTSSEPRAEVSGETVPKYPKKLQGELLRRKSSRRLVRAVEPESSGVVGGQGPQPSR